ncbi:MAG: helix-turn-helix domain-containing protein [Deltaproteobacteria bacterium]|jgi:putative transcriptional regulator|nr:helix-turn-helix domain-containing protein [Deltaproteobacteria bacterium]MBT4268589.1 helix-turn-helix domain-containing protein [Deltaproteobacteria bacterium]MBT4643788.1 helix-turn-helix domain-containing protein [Deltaproteobacteria bacterium]MBT6504080.1 helix-turn-helix domain-containing protein [Deltaproteobacteria bacterium]MBT6613567.1 helix-turn-helix domain-containing protein [Deltaproteobacteria bacterium]
MEKRDIGAEILEGLNEIKSFKKGKVQLVTRKLKDPPNAKDIRDKLSLSQENFSALLGVRKRTLQEWEQGRRKPNGPARALLRVANDHPKVFLSLER